MTNCPSGQSYQNGVCTQGSTPTPTTNNVNYGSSSDNTGWYAGAIVIGVVTLVAYFAFVGYIVYRWKSGEDGASAAQPAAQPGAASVPPQSNYPAPMVPPDAGVSSIPMNQQPPESDPVVAQPAPQVAQEVKDPQ